LHEFEANDIKFPVWKHEARTKITKRNVPDRVDSSANSGVDPVGKRQAKPAKKRFGTVALGRNELLMKTWQKKAKRLQGRNSKVWESACD